MKRDFGIKLIIIPLLFLPGTFGCLPKTGKIVVGPKPEIVTPSILPADIIDRKIAYLRNILKDEGLDHGEREMASNLLAAYETIRSASRDPSTQPDYREIINILFNNLTRLDEKYFTKERSKHQQYAKVIHLFSLKRKKILDGYLNGDYRGVINDCLELEASFGPDSLTPEIGLVFAMSLAQKGLVKEALSIGEKIALELEGRPDLIHLRARILQWHLGLGNREQALPIYEKLIDDLGEREGIFKSAEKEVILKKGKTMVPGDVSSDKPPLPEIDIQEPGPLDQVLKEVDKLVQKHEFRKAKFLLIRQKIRIGEGPEIETIDQAIQSVDLSEQRFSEEKKSKEVQEKENIDLAVKLIEEEKFDEAITKLEDLKDGQEMPPETRELKDLAIEKLINRERNKAAKLFLMARNANDPVKKEELLVSSHKILKALVDKYSTSPLLDKINNHIIKIKEALDKLKKNPG